MSVSLNYGSLTLHNDYCDIHYNAPGYGCDINNLHRCYLSDIANQIESTARSNINYLDQQIACIDAGNSLCQCVQARFMCQPTPEQCVDACEKFQGGFVKFYTREEVEAMKEPYYKMLDDANVIRKYVLPCPEEGPPPPPPNQPPPPTLPSPVPTRVLTVEIATGKGSTSPPPGKHSYPHGSKVVVEAKPARGYVFDYWTIDGSMSISSKVEVVIDRDRIAKAYFSPGVRKHRPLLSLLLYLFRRITGK